MSARCHARLASDAAECEHPRVIAPGPRAPLSRAVDVLAPGIPWVPSLARRRTGLLPAQKSLEKIDGAADCLFEALHPLLDVAQMRRGRRVAVAGGKARLSSTVSVERACA